MVEYIMFDLREYGAINTAKESLSFAALHSVVSYVGGTCQQTNHAGDDMGVDANCYFNLPYSQEQDSLEFINFGVQLKSTSSSLSTRTKGDREYWSYPCKIGQLEKYTTKRLCPLFIVLFIFPSDDEYSQWLHIDAERLELRKSMYWIPAEGIVKPEDHSSSVQLYFPKKNILTSDSLVHDILIPLAKRKVLRYEGI